MLLTFNKSNNNIAKIRTCRLSDFNIDERKLQDILFQSLDRLFPDDELIMLMQSRRWQEEPDIMAIDKHGHLFIFELKAWESRPENILQVLRYGQLFGSSDYQDLNILFKKFTSESMELRKAFTDKFGNVLNEADFNKKQIFIVLTNGLDYRTREAIKYWRTCNLDIRPWVYRVYKGHDNEVQIEISPFRVDDNPYEDIAEGYYILNTNYKNDHVDHDDMLLNKKAAAYFEPWKYKIARLSKGDIVFLYQSGVGIVAFGEASGKLEKHPFHGEAKHADEEYCMQLKNFINIMPALTAAEIKRITTVDYVFMGTMFGVDFENGKKIKDCLLTRIKKNGGG
jgi:hypothetical protein